jgi:hypothetical protein
MKKQFLLLILICIAASFAVGATGLSHAGLERNLRAHVVDDKDGYLGILHTYDVKLIAGERQQAAKVFRLRNNLRGRVRVKVQCLQNCQGASDAVVEWLHGQEKDIVMFFDKPISGPPYVMQVNLEAWWHSGYAKLQRSINVSVVLPSPMPVDDAGDASTAPRESVTLSP